MIRVVDLEKSFGEPPVRVLKGLNFEIPTGKFVSVTGRSGSGKSTLLYTISTLDQPTSGDVIIDDHSLGKMTEEEVHRFRNERMGFVFQFHYLLSELTALENVLMPARKTDTHSQRSKRGEELLAHFGLGDKLDRLPKQLSGGEQQRVAIARSLVMDPKYLFADEPTGNLDSVNGDIVMGILKDVTKTFRSTVIYVTHDADFANLADVKLVLQDGQLVK